MAEVAVAVTRGTGTPLDDTRPGQAEAERDAAVWPSQDEEELLRRSDAHWALAQDAESRWRDQAVLDQRFAAGQQWPDVIKARRDAEGRPCLVIDRMGTHLRMVANEALQNRPGIVVSPADQSATPETALKLQGKVRDIEQRSNADIAYGLAMEHAVTIGRGYVRVHIEYCDDFTFERTACILPVLNPFTVYLDPSHQMPDGSDAEWGFCIERLARDQYEAEYGTLPVDATSWAMSGDTWFTASDVQVADYYWREWHPLALALLPSGEVVMADRVPEGVTPSETRTAKVPQVWHCRRNGREVLSQTQWPGRYIPIAQCIGELTLIEGDKDWQGLTRRMIDAQRGVNFWKTAEAETIALAPKAPFIGAAQQFEGYERYWQQANVANLSYLPYQPFVIGGQVLPPPQRSAVEPPVQAIVQGAMMAADDLKAISGFYDPALGNQAQDTQASGTAIAKRQTASNTATYHYGKHQQDCVRHVGRILVDLLPRLITGPRAERIVGEDGQASQVLFNQPFTDQDTGQQVQYDLTTGAYEVTVHAGPSFQTQRQETTALLATVFQASPQLLPILGDLFFSQLDVHLATQMAERMKKSMPPQLLAGEPGAQKYTHTAEAMQQLAQVPAMQQQMQKQQAQMMQMQQAVESLSQTNSQLQLQLTNKQRELELEHLKLQLADRDNQQQWQVDDEKNKIAMYEATTDRLKLGMAANGSTPSGAA